MLTWETRCSVDRDSQNSLVLEGVKSLLLGHYGGLIGFVTFDIKFIHKITKNDLID